MQEQLAITLKPDRVTARAGGAAEPVTVQIHNRTHEIDSYAIELDGPDADWYTLPIKTLTLFPDDPKTLSLLWHPPLNFETLAGRYDYTVRVRSTVLSTRVQEVPGALFVALPEALNVALTSKLSRGQVGRFEATITNRTKTRQQVILHLEDREGLLEYKVAPALVQLEPGDHPEGRQTIELTVEVRPGQILTSERTFPFTLYAQTTDESAQSNVVKGEFIYTPILLRMELVTARLKGIEGRFQLNVSNPGSNPVPMEISAKDPDNALDITFEVTGLSLQPNTSQIFPLRVRLKDGRKPELRAYPFTLNVRPRGAGSSAPDLGPPINGEFVYEPPAEFELTMQPTGRTTPTECDYTVQLVNSSPVALRLSLHANDAQQALGLYFGSRVDQLLLRAGETLQVQLLARLQGAPPAQAITYPFSVRAHAIPDDGSSEMDKTATAEFVCAGPSNQPMLRLDLLPPQARGEVGHFQVRVTSGVGNTLPVQLRGRDEDNALQYKFEPTRVQLAPEGVEVADLVVSLRNGHTMNPQQSYGFEVIAWVPGMGTNGATTRPGTWGYTPPARLVAALALQLDSTQIIGDIGQVQLTLHNQGAIPLTVQLRGSDDAEALEFLFQTQRLQLQPQEIKPMSLIIRGRDGVPLPGPYRYPFMVAGLVSGMETTTASIQHGELVVTEAPPTPPFLLPWQRLGMAALLVAWIALPFILNGLRIKIEPLVYQMLAALAFPLIGAAMINVRPTQVRGWRAVLIGWIGFSGFVSVILMTVLGNASIPGTNFPAAAFVNLLLIPALLIVLFV